MSARPDPALTVVAWIIAYIIGYAMAVIYLVRFIQWLSCFPLT